MSAPARLVLADGRVFHGRSFGAKAEGGMEVVAEVVFNTSHVGYQEVLTDPSYSYEAVTFTMPVLGIYGMGDSGDEQSAGPRAAAVLCREVSKRSSSWRARQTLPEYMAERGISGIEGIDTRSLAQHLRDQGSMIGVLCNYDPQEAGYSDEELAARARKAPPMTGLDLAKTVTTDAPYLWDEAFTEITAPWCKAFPDPGVEPGSRGEVVVLDFGVKRDILRHLAARGFRLKVMPAQTSAAEILELQPRGVFLSNGPGDPAAVHYGADTVRGLLAREDLPVFGVCLGHQILSLACGAKTLKLKFGHRGANHPVRELATGRVLITSHNHGFAVDPESLAGTPLEPSYMSLFDGALEGVSHCELPVASTQFHPEAGPGPHDAGAFFDRFVAAVEGQVSAASR